jgi:polar amino acid transport system substrate-binding protein
MLQRLLVYVLLSLPVLVQADSLRLVSGNDYAPFTGEDLPSGGMLSQVVQAALAERDIASTLDWRPWNRGYLMTLQAEYDATFPYVRTAERELVYAYSEPLFVAEQHLFSRAGEVFEADNLEALVGTRICYPLGWQPPAAIQRLVDEGRLIRHSPTGLDECAKLLLLNRDDFFVSDLRLGQAALRATGAPLSRFRRSLKVFSSSALHLIVSRQHPRAEEIIASFNTGLASLRASGKYQQIIDEYLQQHTQVD